MESRPLTLVKWGGSLITDKSQPESVRHATLERLASELRSALDADQNLSVVLGHGSGSFGHWSAKDSFLSDPRERPDALSREELAAAAATADAAARLHGIVIAKLLRAEIPALSWLASSATSAADPSTPSDPEAGLSHLVELSARRGFVPVTGGDVLVSEPMGAVIWSTEQIFRTLVRDLQRRGLGVARVVWLGNTDGILDASGETVPRVDDDNAERAAEAVAGSDGVDVTGGMRLRFDYCRDLARDGVESWVLDGQKPGVLTSALLGERVGGTAFL